MRYSLALMALMLLSTAAVSQPLDHSNAPDCSPPEVARLAETIARYQGIRGRNPGAPSTYELIGDHKLSGGLFGLGSAFFGENWFPIRTEKLMLTGTFHKFGVANYGDENDWNIHLLPDAGFEDLIADAIPYRSETVVGSDEWGTAPDGRFLVEAEITPDERRYGNEWFTNSEKSSPLVRKRLTVYGPYVREEAHGNRPEIHPAEQIWWKDGADTTIVLLVVDDSNRFNDSDDYAKRRAITPNVPWTQENGQRAELSVAFEVDPARTGLFFSVQALDDLQFLRQAPFPDASGGNPIQVSYRGNIVLSVEQTGAVDPFIGVTFQGLCVNRAKRTLQGYVVLNTAIGNGDGKEGFVALHIQRQEVGFDAGQALLTGDLLNTWKLFAPYDTSIPRRDIHSSDMRGMGIIDGILDFNGNGKSDLFAHTGTAWMVLFDGRGTWQQLNASSVPFDELRFGDVDGDRRTDILRVGPNKKVQVSFGGTGPWTVRTDAGEQNSLIQVGDFNGDGRTDIVYLKRHVPLITVADMFVKFSAQGSWKTLNEGYRLGTDDYRKTFRFGDFNADGITDIFRFRDGRFGVYWSGAGDFKELHRPSPAVDVDDLLFVDELTSDRLTDVIHVHPDTKRWTVFPGGKPGTLPLQIRYGDPAVVRFGDLDSDPATEPFAVDFVPQRRSPGDVRLTAVAKTVVDPVVYTRYVPGSLKRAREGDRSFLTVSLNLQRSPGTRPMNRKGQDLRSISAVTAGTKPLAFKRIAALEAGAGDIETLGTIENIPLADGEEKQEPVQIAFGAAAAPVRFELAQQGITAVANAVVERPGTADVSWQAWQGFLSASVRGPTTALLAAPPAPPSRVHAVSFELVPFYSSREEGKVSAVEMDGVARELNEIAYGPNRERAEEIFGDRAPFTIAWHFELRNMTTGALLPIESPASMTADGRWPRNKVRFTFPTRNDLLRFQATATVSDRLGNRTLEPVELVFWNQRIALTDAQVAQWLEPLLRLTDFDGPRLLVKAKWLAEDGVLTPAEVASILR